MPVPSPFFSHRWVLRTTDRHITRITCHTDITANALTDVFDAPLFDLVRQERVSNGWPRRADQVHHTATNGRDHRIRRCVSSHANDWLCSQLFDERDVVL